MGHLVGVAVKLEHYFVEQHVRSAKKEFVQKLGVELQGGASLGYSLIRQRDGLQQSHAVSEVLEAQRAQWEKVWRAGSHSLQHDVLLEAQTR